MRKILILALCCALLPLTAQKSYAGEIDILVKKLVDKKILTEDEAKEILAETRKEIAREITESKALTSPEWTQKIKISGDIRNRLQTDWGKGLAPAHQRTQDQIRARAAIEAKINEQVQAGVRVASGPTSNARSSNQTLTGAFNKKSIWFDLFYLAWFPQFDVLKNSSLWLGKFENPFERTELTWDTDIDPEGLAFKYVSPTFKTSLIPEFTVYGNFGVLWLEEIQTAETDPMLWIWQVGSQMLLNADSGTSLDLSAAYYNPTRDQHRTLTGTAGTNTLFPSTDRQYANTLRYDYDMLDFLIQLDNKKLLEYDLPFGLWGDLIMNPSLSENNLGCMTGAYIGSKKPKEPGQWKVFGAFQMIERDAILDILPDQDFYGFTNTGTPASGGTNAYGFFCGAQYRILKNTLLGFKYAWSAPLKTEVINAQERNSSYQYLRSEILVNF